MKKIVLGSLLVTGVFVSSVSALQQTTSTLKTIAPNFGTIAYDTSANKSAKEKTLFGGFYASIGDLSYLSEFSYEYMDTRYKDTTITDLKQHDIAFMYSKYYASYMFKGGLHYINTNDTILGDGITLATALGGYKFKNYDKYSYGVEGYYSNYNNGHNEDGVQKSISIVQLTPYFGFYKTINSNNKNSFNLKFNYQITSNYTQKSYSSLEVSDTYYYKRLFSTIQAYLGKMKTGIRGGGMVVYNTLDLEKNEYSLRLGYYLKSNFIVSANYTIDSYREYLKNEDAKNNTALFSLTYRY